ncbi:sterol desaturase family protein [Hahella sp. KA22]|uniref:sterol desaturase family protein n=1 Tax=Hahella sp. KA22 TaxID=1628392 RepID=UPI000FDCFFB0|nr:sterol desaturase family protein [Hahella sp. KA22]AZZ93828.1 sterol desaturase family protein [Hahella sp. KA22]QAY57201.1 sterol desaturase family protein [Hahella sp. KA22]
MKLINDYLSRHGHAPFKFGQGRISGYISATLGILSFLAVLCFHFPEYLTTQELRQVYTEQFARTLMLVALCASFILGLLSFLLNQQKRLSMTGVLFSTAAVVAGGADIQLNSIGETPYSLGLDWFILALFFSALVFIPMERAFAQKRETHTLRPEWRTDLAYFFMSHMLVQFILIFTTSSSTYLVGWVASDSLRDAIQSMPVWAQFLLAVFMADFSQYWFHRLYHTVPFLWKFHAVHHSSKHMDWLAGSRVHLVEILITRSVVMVPLFLLGFSAEALNAYVILVGVQAVLAHANLNFNFGFLKYILVTPQYHHWHHADDPAYAYKNYAIHLPIIDMLFGTFKLPGKEWPKSYGLLNNKTVPKGIVRQHMFPFGYDE